MKYSLFIAFFIFLCFVRAYACKDYAFGEIYPIKNFDKYDLIVTAVIKKARRGGMRYTPLISFKAVVQEILKGNRTKGLYINGRAKKEHAHAVCPVQLERNKVYLLLLEKEDNDYVLSRFSLPVSEDNKYFLNYIKQIKKLLRQQ